MGEKKLAAGFITRFFQHFPTLSESAMDAMLDLIEDEDAQVRVVQVEREGEGGREEGRRKGGRGREEEGGGGREGGMVCRERGGDGRETTVFTPPVCMYLALVVRANSPCLPRFVTWLSRVFRTCARECLTLLSATEWQMFSHSYCLQVHVSNTQ